MSSFAEFAQRTEIVARFKRVLLLFWLPLVLAAAVPAVMIVVAAWFESPNSIQLLPPSPKEPPLPELEVVPPAPTPVLGDGTPAVAQMTLDGTLAVAQQFPGGKLVEMTVMFGAGSAADVTARHLADGMSKSLGVPVPVVNRTGGGGAIGYSHVQQQKPDGYSIIWNSNSVSTNYHSGIMSFDYKAFDAVARVSVETPAIAVRGDAPWKTLKELIDYAKANPGKVRIGNSGAGSHTHFVSSALFGPADAKIINVPFGEGQAVVNLLGSRIEGIVQLPAALVAHVKSGDLRVLAVLGEKRDPVFADVPTAKELGFAVALDMWRGIAVPTGTPKPVIAKLQDAIKQSVEAPTFKDAGKSIGFIPAYLSSQDFAKLIASDDVRLAQLMDELGLKKK